MPTTMAGAPIPMNQFSMTCQVMGIGWPAAVIHQMYNNPARLKITAPTSSCLQEMIAMTSRITAGMLCRIRPKTVPQRPKFSEKTSRENIIRNGMNRPVNILGAQAGRSQETDAIARKTNEGIRFNNIPNPVFEN